MAGRSSYADTKTVLQIEATECGAACLSMILQYYGQYVSLEQLRLETDVSRDGCSAGNIVRAAQRRGLECDGYQIRAEELANIVPPCILWWDHNHFVVFEGMKKGACYINDPAYGKRRMDLQRLARHFSGILLTFEVGPDFQSFPEYGVKPETYLRSGRSGSFIRNHGLQVGVALFSGWISTAALLVLSLTLLKNCGSLWLSALLVILFLMGRVFCDFQLGRMQDLNELQMSWRFLRRLFHLPIDFLEQRTPEDLVERVRRDRRISRFTAGDMIRVFIELGSIVLSLCVAFWICPPAALALVVAAGLVFLIQYLWERELIPERTRAAIVDTELITIIYSGIRRLQTIRGLKLGRKYASDAARCQQESMNMHQKLQKSELTAVVCRYVIYGVSLIVSQKLVMGIHALGPALPFVWFLLFVILFVSLETLLGIGGHLSRIDDEIGSVDDVLRVPVIVDESEPEKSGASGQYRKLQGNIRFYEVGFSYGAFGERIVSNLNLYLPVGSMLAVTGQSGSGKSTVGKLFGGLISPSEGQVLYDGKTLDDIPEQVVFASIAMVGQKSHLFQGTIRDNITMWNPNITDEALERAIEDACVKDFIDSRPEGLMTVLGDRGVGVSGGEQQRIEIARALATDPTILILDEAFSAIDDETTETIMANIRRRGSTVIMMTHDDYLIDLCSHRLDLNKTGGDM